LIFTPTQPVQVFQDRISRLLQFNATAESPLREMLLTAQLHDKSLSSPADTPRSPSRREAAKPLQSTRSSSDVHGSEETHSQSPNAQSPNLISGRSPVIYEAGQVGDDASESGSVSKKSTQAAKSSSPLDSARSTDGNASSSRALIESSLPSPQISAAAAEAAGKAGQLAQEMKNALDVQKKHARYQAVQAAAAQQNAAHEEHILAKKIMEAAYDAKVEEAAVLRRECAKLQETIDSLRLELDSYGVKGPNEGDKASEEESFSKLQQHNAALEADIQVTPAFYAHKHFVTNHHQPNLFRCARSSAFKLKDYHVFTSLAVEIPSHFRAGNKPEAPADAILREVCCVDWARSNV
jgi:hypothetical protein